MPTETLAKLLAVAGALLLLVAAVVYLGGRFHVPLGRLPGDLRFERGQTSFYFPVVSSIAVSIVLTVIVNLVMRFWRR